MPLLDQNRLGYQRRNIRDLSVHMRRFGKSSNERLLLEKRYTKSAQLFSLMIIETMIRYGDREDVTDDEEMILNMFGLGYITNRKKVVRIQTPNLGRADPIERVTISIESFSDQDLYSKTGYHGEEIVSMMAEMKIPDSFTLGKGWKIRNYSILWFLILNASFNRFS